MIVFKYDGINFIRTADGKWICKAWAMKGPTGNMMNKEVPEKYAIPIEEAYKKKFTREERKDREARQARLDEALPKPKTKTKVRTRKKASIEPASTKLKEIKSKIKRKRKASAPKKSIIKPIKKVKKKAISGFNPFAQ